MKRGPSIDQNLANSRNALSCSIAYLRLALSAMPSDERAPYVDIFQALAEEHSQLITFRQALAGAPGSEVPPTALASSPAVLCSQERAHNGPSERVGVSVPTEAERRDVLTDGTLAGLAAFPLDVPLGRLAPEPPGREPGWSQGAALYQGYCLICRNRVEESDNEAVATAEGVICGVCAK